jgi:hypothetical protein
VCRVQKLRAIGVAFLSPDPGEKTSKGQKQNLSIKERSSTAVYRPIIHFAELRYPSLLDLRQVRRKALFLSAHPRKIRLSERALEHYDFTYPMFWG